jgi:hypothetical protein
MKNASESGKHLICGRLITEEQAIRRYRELLPKATGDHRIDYRSERLWIKCGTKRAAVSGTICCPGYNAQGWRNTIHMMLNVGANLPASEIEFGSNRIARIDPDTMEIREYVLPNAESRPRRLAITSGDVLWYTDFARGYLGRFDSASGKTAEWPSPGGPKSQPYGIAAVDNVLWYSEAGVQPNTIVRFDPQDGEIPDVENSLRRRRGA